MILEILQWIEKIEPIKNIVFKTIKDNETISFLRIVACDKQGINIYIKDHNDGNDNSVDEKFAANIYLSEIEKTNNNATFDAIVNIAVVFIEEAKCISNPNTRTAQYAIIVSVIKKECDP